MVPGAASGIPHCSFPHPLTGESVEELQLLPQRDGINGFYLCLFEKTKESKE